MQNRELRELVDNMFREPPDSGAISCPICGSMTRSTSGECDNCGSYKCNTCKRLHLGEATQKCPGPHFGVPDPRG